MKHTLPIFGLATLVILSAIQACTSSTGNQKTTQPREYLVETVGTTDVTLYRDFPTTLQGLQTVEIRPRVAGYIEKILVDEGDLVRKGQILFILNANDIEAQVRSAEAQVKVTEAQVETARINVEKTRPLVEKDIVSEFELQSVKTNLSLAEAQLAQAQANLANAKANLSYTRIASPTDGIIGNFPYRVGSLVSSTSTRPLTTVSNTATLQAYFSMNERTFLSFVKGLDGKNTREKLAQLPPVSLVLSDQSVYPLTGQIETASGIIDAQTGAINIRASFANPEGILRSGSSGRVRLPELHKNVLLIPQAATFDIQGKHFVYVVHDGNKVVNTAIEVITGNLKSAYVVTRGLSEGDKIVVEGLSSLQNGMVISPKLTGSTVD